MSLLPGGVSGARSALPSRTQPVAGVPDASAATRYVPGQLLVAFRATTGNAARARLLAAVGASVVQRVSSLHLDVVHVPRGQEASAESLLRASPLVSSAERDALAPAAGVTCPGKRGCLLPNDPLFRRQWGLVNDASTIASGAGAVFGADIAAPAAWHYARSNRWVRIAIIDTGIDGTHPDLRGKVVFNSTLAGNHGNATDLNGHGTAVAGVAAAIPNNGIGIAGSGYNASLMNIKETDDSDPAHPVITGSAEAGGIVLATDHGANIINISYTGSTYLQAVQDAVTYAWNHGVLLIAAAGNDNTAVPTYPGAYNHVIAVAATNSADRRASFSNANARWVQLAAPGVGLVTTTPEHRNPFGPRGYAYVSGTSFSAPLVAGVAALLWPITKDTNGDGHINDEVAQRLLASADRIPGTGTFWSRGRLDACRAVTQAASQCAARAHRRPRSPG